jgi:hypothetical protein
MALRFEFWGVTTSNRNQIPSRDALFAVHRLGREDIWHAKFRTLTKLVKEWKAYVIETPKTARFRRP